MERIRERCCIHQLTIEVESGASLGSTNHFLAYTSNSMSSLEGYFLLSVWHTSCPARFMVSYFPLIDT
jgi:hypothetical protein